MKKEKLSKIYLWLIVLLVAVLILLIFIKDAEDGFSSKKITEEVGFERITSPGADCFLEDFDEDFVINSQEGFDNLKDSELAECYDVGSWNFDPETSTLLGRKIEVSGCSYEIEEEVTRNYVAKKFVFDIDVEAQGPCDAILLSYYDVISIEKVPVDYGADINLEVEQS